MYYFTSLFYVASPACGIQYIHSWSSERLNGESSLILKPIFGHIKWEMISTPKYKININNMFECVRKWVQDDLNILHGLTSFLWDRVEDDPFENAIIQMQQLAQLGMFRPNSMHVDLLAKTRKGWAFLDIPLAGIGFLAIAVPWHWKKGDSKGEHWDVEDRHEECSVSITEY